MTARTAIIGLGIMGRRMLEHMLRHPGYQPVALWDPDPLACQEGPRALAPDVRIATSADDAMADAELVYLACPPVPRKAYALAAKRDGKAVFLEKNRSAWTWPKARRSWQRSGRAAFRLQSISPRPQVRR